MMNEQSTSKAPVWFWVVGALALVWNLMGVMAYISQVTMSPETLAALPADQQELMQNVPAWATGAFAIAVFAGALGCLLLLLRKKLAIPVLGLSLLGILVQMVYNFFVSNSMEVYGPGAAIMPIMVIIIGAALVWLGRMAAEKGWIT